MPDIDRVDVKKILIIDLAFIGDVILAGPLTMAVRRKWPQGEIVMLTVPLTASVAEMLPAVDRALVYDKKGSHQGLGGMWQMAKELRREKFDLAICMNFALRGAVVSRLAGIPYRLGYDAQHAGWFLTWAASHVREGIKHETLNHLEVLRPWGMDASYLSAGELRLRLEPPKEAVEAFEEKAAQWELAAKGGYYVLCPLGSYARKNLPLPLAVQLIRQLEAEKPVYLIGGPQEEAALTAMAKAGHIGGERVLAGRLALPELAVFLQRAAAMVSVDTGPMHIAQGVQCPVVAVFGPTDPAVWGPQNDNSRTIYLAEPCSPCWGRGECRGARCMEKIKAAMVLSALDSIKHIKQSEKIDKVERMEMAEKVEIADKMEMAEKMEMADKVDRRA